MKAHELRTLLPSLLLEVQAATDIAKTAESNKKSLGGNNSYAERFHTSVVAITGTEK